MSKAANEVKEQAAATISANEANNGTVLPVVEQPKEQTAPLATSADISAFITSKVEAPKEVTSAIDTSDIDLYSYRVEDADINAIYTDAGWKHIRLIDGDGNVVPNARLEITHISGNKYKIIPFFMAILVARKSTIELQKESQLKLFSEQGSLKARGNTFKFQMTKEQQDALTAKARMNWETEVKTLTEKFQAWLGSFHPTVAQLDTLFTAFNAAAVLVVLGEKVFIRHIIHAGTDTAPLVGNEHLNQVAVNEDKIGDVTLSTTYTFELV